MLRAQAPVPSSQLGLVGHLHVPFLPPLGQGLEKARSVSELFPARASAP